MKTPRRFEWWGDDVVTLTGLFAPDECDALVAYAEALGFGDAPITTGRGFVRMPEMRNNTRAMVDDPDRAALLFQRIAPYLRPRHALRQVGLNERLRFYRYDPGQYFRWHSDGSFARKNGERSDVTVMLYLNEGFLGGSTDFRSDDETLRIIPERGQVLLFSHHLRHQGAPLLAGTKYVLRTDLMFAPE